MKYNTREIEEKMSKSIAAYEVNLSSIRASQANPAVLNRVTFDYWGSPAEITSMANIRVSDAKTLEIIPYDASTLKAMEKAIQTSDIGINPTNDGNVIRLIFPALTEERRKELVKQVKKMSEDAKVAARNIRRDTLDTLKKLKNGKEITEDECNDFSDTVEKSVSDIIAKIEKATAEKEKDVMTV